MKSLNQINLSILLGSLLLSNPISSQELQDNTLEKQLILSVLYTQTSTEFIANNIQTYTSAASHIEEALSDKSWTASLEQKSDFSLKQPAIILDVDETVLDNTPFQARAILTGCSYPCGWVDWGLEASADPVAGVKEFLSYAKSKNIKIFYVTNRVSELEDATKKNIKALGLPFDEDVDVLLMKGENNWTSDKTARRALVAKNHRIILMIGDQLGDFISLKETEKPVAERKKLGSKYKDMWGTKWFMIANPMYGRWESAIYGNKYPESEEDLIQMRLDALRTE